MLLQWTDLNYYFLIILYFIIPFIYTAEHKTAMKDKYKQKKKKAGGGCANKSIRPMFTLENKQEKGGEGGRGKQPGNYLTTYRHWGIKKEKPADKKCACSIASAKRSSTGILNTSLSHSPTHSYRQKLTCASSSSPQIEKQVFPRVELMKEKEI